MSIVFKHHPLAALKLLILPPEALQSKSKSELVPHPLSLLLPLLLLLSWTFAYDILTKHLTRLSV